MAVIEKINWNNDLEFNKNQKWLPKEILLKTISDVEKSLDLSDIGIGNLSDIKFWHRIILENQNKEVNPLFWLYDDVRYKVLNNIIEEADPKDYAEHIMDHTKYKLMEEFISNEFFTCKKIDKIDKYLTIEQIKQIWAENLVFLESIEDFSSNMEKPNIKYMLDILENNEPQLLAYHKNIYNKNKVKENYKYNSFEEYIYSQYWQLWSSKIIDKKSKIEDWPYYYRPEYLNHKWELVESDIYRKDWDIFEYSKQNNISDFNFQWWWFNMH